MSNGKPSEVENQYSINRVGEDTVSIEQSIPPLDMLEIAGALQSVLNQTEGRDYTLDIQQESALKAIGEAMLDGKQSGYIEMATGTGKTAIEALVAEAIVQSGRRVLILAPKISIAEQLSGSDTAKPLGLSRFTNLHDTANIGHHYGTSRATANDDVVISTYQSFLQMGKNNRSVGDFDVIIADECHRSLGAQTAEAMRTTYPDAIKLGFSATPDFATNRQSDEIFDEKLFNFSLIDAIEAGTTAPLRSLVFETSQALTVTNARGDFTEKELAPLVKNINRNGTAVNLAIDLVRSGRQGIIATIPGEHNIHARLMADMLNNYEGVVALEVGAHLSVDENAFRLQEYQKGTIDVLTFTRALEEGWDSDVASFCINMAPTTSPVRTKQLMGRVLRRKKDALESIYVDFIDINSSVDKKQYTSLHALGLATVDANRVLGVYSQNQVQDWHKTNTGKLPAINPSLLAELMASNGKLIDEITIAKRETAEPLVALWEAKLNQGTDKLPAELPHIVLGEEYDKARAAAIKIFIIREGLEPTEEEILEEIYSSSKINESFKQRGLGRFATQLNIDDMPEVDETTYYDPDHLPLSPEYIAIGNLAKEAIHTLLIEKFSEHESYILRKRFGIYGDTPLTFKQIGIVLGVSSEYVRQSYYDSIAKLSIILPLDNVSPDVIHLQKEQSLDNFGNRVLDFRQSGYNLMADIESQPELTIATAVSLIKKYSEFLGIVIDTDRTSQTDIGGQLKSLAYEIQRKAYDIKRNAYDMEFTNPEAIEYLNRVMAAIMLLAEKMFERDYYLRQDSSL